MVNAWLIVVTVIMIIVLLVVNTYMLAVYCHPEDRGFGVSLFCKLLVVLGFTLAWGLVLLLPLDVGNSRGSGGGLNMQLFWYITIITAVVFLVALLPFAMFFYETDEERSFCSRVFTAFWMTLFFVIIAALLYGITFIFLKQASIPVETYTQSALNFHVSSTALGSTETSTQTKASATLDLDVSFIVYLMALTAFIGWFLFILFGGIGLFGIGIDLMSNYKFRRSVKDKKDLARRHKELKAACEELMDQGNQLKGEKDEMKLAKGWWESRRLKSKHGRTMNRWKAAVYSLDRDFEVLKLELQITNTHPIVFVFKCIAGLILFLVALAWIVHIIIFMLAVNSNGVPLSTFLNAMLIKIEEGNASFISTGIFALLCIFLLWACQKGNVKFGLRIPFCCAIHPMKVNETLMNSFLFNVILLLLCAFPVVQFSNQAFSQYTRLTTIDTIFGIQVQYLTFFKYFFQYNVFVIAFVVWAGVTGILQICLPASKPLKVKQLEELKKQKF